MGWGFEIGRTYNRRADIHGKFGGQQQGGIITPANYPLVIIITGEEGLEHGYAVTFNFRFGAHNGLKSDIALCPLSANFGRSAAGI
jgi:hypothetical protein